MAVERLSGDRLVAVDPDDANAALRGNLARRIDRNRPDGNAFFLDTSGGNGVFADHLTPARAGAVSAGTIATDTPLRAGNACRGHFRDGPAPSQYFSTGLPATA